jgi:hypothetical protein
MNYELARPNLLADLGFRLRLPAPFNLRPLWWPMSWADDVYYLIFWFTWSVVMGYMLYVLGLGVENLWLRWQLGERPKPWPLSLMMRLQHFREAIRSEIDFQRQLSELQEELQDEARTYPKRKAKKTPAP